MQGHQQFYLIYSALQVVAILLAREVIAVNQDELGVAGDLVWKEGPNEVRALRA